MSFLAVATLIPMTSPASLKVGPPLMPGFKLPENKMRLSSVWLRMPPLVPTAMLSPRSRGLPMAKMLRREVANHYCEW
eukprot:UN10021